MTQQSKHIETTKTARYYTLGNVNSETKNIWMILHGYAQQGETFIQQFKNFAEQGDYIVAPEGLSKFYTKGLLGAVGASWMTKEDRENEIKDNIKYLEKLYDAEIASINNNATIHLLGFSQGASTLTRFISFKNPKLQHIWVCAGDIPTDIHWENFKHITDNATLHILLGKQDPLIAPEKVVELSERLQQNKIKFALHEFDGAHEMNMDILANYRR
jgi:predicted esterase